MKLMPKLQVVFLFIYCFSSLFVNAQISSEAEDMVPTEYSSGTQDQIYIFCTAPNEQAGMLKADAPGGGAASFEWGKYNPATGSFDVFLTENSGSTSSTVNNLADGGYRVTVTEGTESTVYTAWVMNSWYTATAEVSESTCEYFQLTAAFDEANLTYYDLSTGQVKNLFKDVKAKWMVDGLEVSSLLSPQIYGPPAENTNYMLTVYDRFGCQVEVPVTYQSVVTEASFTANPSQGDAPLEVAFTSTSKNADEYEWFFFRERGELIEEGQAGGVVDSILQTAIDPNPTFVFEKTGSYEVKLVTTKNNGNFACTDTVYLDGYIEVDESDLFVPNVFTPNGDGDNDEFVVAFKSMQSVDIQIFNRWGRKVHVWKSSNIRNSEEAQKEAVWDGRIGGRLASPGVYYYVVEAKGRDGKAHNDHGFVHLFREK